MQQHARELADRLLRDRSADDAELVSRAIRHTLVVPNDFGIIRAEQRVGGHSFLICQAGYSQRRSSLVTRGITSHVAVAVTGNETSAMCSGRGQLSSSQP